MTANDFRALIKEAQSQIAKGRTIVERFEKTRYESWQELAGKHLQEMLSSPQQAESHLLDAERGVRYVALNVLSDYWEVRPGDDAARKIEELARSDPDPQIRGVALVCLGACYENTKDPCIAKLLARVVLDDQQPTATRRCAYMGLLN